MSTAKIPAIRPTSLVSIKRLATSIGHDLALPHTQALDRAAQQGGFENYRHARNSLALPPGRGRPAMAAIVERSVPVYVTAYWRDSDHGEEGRETMRWFLPRPLDEVVGARPFLGFRVDAGDHLEQVEDSCDRELAQMYVLRAIRWLQFMVATGLQPMRARGRAPLWWRGLPAQDHSTLWCAPAVGAEILADEPYRDADQLLPRRMDWACANEAVVAAPKWGGMYLPPASTLFLTSRREHEATLRHALDGLEAAAAPVRKWSGESAPYMPVFLSPTRLDSGKRKRARPQPPAWWSPRGAAAEAPR